MSVKHAIKVLSNLILLIVLCAGFSACGTTQSEQTATPLPIESPSPSPKIPTPNQATATPITPSETSAQEPRQCTFPLAQTTTAESTPENYIFSDPKVVLTAPKGNHYHIVQWLPDNQQALITEDLDSNYIYQNDSVPQQSISLYNALTGASKVYAVRPYNSEPPSWQPALNAVAYRATSYSNIDKAHNTWKFTDQLWASHGDPNAAQKLADNLSQFPFVVRPDGSEMVYRSGNKISGLDKSLKAIPSISFDPTQWDYAKERRDISPLSFQMVGQPDTSLIFLYSNGIGGGGYTFVLNVNTGRVCELNLGGWAEKAAHWSSDGRYLAFIRSTRYALPTYSADLTVLDTITGNLKVLNVVLPQGTNEYHFVEDFVWAPDNRHLLNIGEIYTSPDTQAKIGLYLVDFVSGQSINVTPTYQFYTNSPQRMAWSPDGSKVAIGCPAMGADRICLIFVHKTVQP